MSLTITPVNDAPVVVSANNTVTHAEDTGGTLTEDASAWFDDVDAGDSFTFRILSVSGSTVISTPTISGGGAISYTVLPNASSSTSIIVEVEDSGGLTGTATLDVNVTPVNDVPFVAVPPANVTELEDVGAVTVDLSNVFDDADIATTGDNLTLTLVSSPTLSLIHI